VVGGRTWDPTSRFRVQIGPVGLKEFEQLMPTGEMLIPICQFIRSYVGLEYDFDLQVILKAEDIPFCRFAGDSPAKEGDTDAEAVTETQVQPHLGWNTWLCSHSPRHDSEDAVFQHDGSPTR
jgi:type VI secretion system protein ImpH